MFSKLLRRNKQTQTVLPNEGWADIISGGLIFRIEFGGNRDNGRFPLVPILSVDPAHDVFQRSDGRMYKLINIDWIMPIDKLESGEQLQAERINNRDELVVRFRELSYADVRLFAAY